MVRLMTKQDIPFFNTVRNECAPKYLHDKTTHTLQEAYDWWEKDEKRTYFIFELEGRSIGYFRVYNWDDNNPKSCFLGMDIHKDYRGKKLAVTGWNHMMEHLTEQYGIKLFQVEILSHNVRSQNCCKKVGFVETKIEKRFSAEFNIFMELRV